MARGLWRWVLGVLAAVLVPSGAAPSDVGAGLGPGDPGLGFSGPAGPMRPRIRIERTPVPPTLDGVLEPEVWDGAPVIQRFAQLEPRAGDPPTEATEIKLLYDRDFLYLGIRCFDREPEKLLAREMVRDVPLTSDDRVSLVIGPYHDQNNGYLFSVNPVGNRWDGLIEPGPDFRDEWDGIWYAKSAIDRAGWTAEIAIPFKTVSFDPSTTTWDFNVMRAIRRRNEIIRWASPTPDLFFTNLGGAGTIEGLVGIEKGIGLDVKPLFALSYVTDRETGDTDRLGRPSLDAFYRVTPSLTGSFTLNTDFSEAPVDERRVNLDRFSLFFPETRDFFLQDAGVFEFAGIEENGRPFFSRKIGIRPSGEPVDLRAGAKLTGRVGRFGVGLLDVQAASYGEVDSQNLGVARFTYDLMEESFVGVIATHGDPTSNEDNAAVGLDVRLRDSHFRGNRVLAADAWLLRSFSEGLAHDEAAFGARIDYPNDRVQFSLEFNELQENYRPALGFVNRVGIRRLDGRFRYRIRPERRLKIVDQEVRTFAVTDTDGDLESAEVAWDVVGLESQVGDRLVLTYSRRQEDLTKPFEISEGVVIPPTSYAFDRVAASLVTTKARSLSFELLLGWGEFFSGNRLESKATVEWRPSRHLLLGLDYEQNDIRLPEGDFTTRLAILRVNVAFTPDLSWTSIAQYDNVSDTFGLQSRFRWIMEPGDEIFIVYNQGFEASERRFRPILSAVTLKVGYTFRF
jgi:hypothetical protein